MPSGRAIAALAAAAAILVSPAVPGPLGEPGRRLANTSADGPDPHWDRDLDGASLRRAGELVPDDATYVIDARTTDPVLIGNLKAAAQLFLAPALPVQSPDEAEWVLRHDNGRVEAVPR